MKNQEKLKVRLNYKDVIVDDELFCEDGFIGVRGYVHHGKDHFCFVASNGEGWEHVSVSLPYRCPTWKEMCHIKSIFWDDDEVVLQYHPKKDEYVNFHPYCLHLWNPIGVEIPRPPTHLIGFVNVKDGKNNNNIE